MLRRRSASRWEWGWWWPTPVESGCAAERVEVVFDVARCRPGRPAGTLVRLGHESVGRRETEPGRELGEGLPPGEDVVVERRARLRPLNEDGALDTSETW